MKILVKKQFGKLIPCYNSDAEALKKSKLKEGEIYEVEIKKKRNYEFHKKYFALLNLCYDNQKQYELFDDLRDYLTVKSGYVRKVVHKNGYEEYKPISISFSSMDETEFNELYQKTITVICQFLGCEKEDLINEILTYA